MIALASKKGSERILAQMNLTKRDPQWRKSKAADWAVSKLIDTLERLPRAVSRLEDAERIIDALGVIGHPRALEVLLEFVPDYELGTSATSALERIDAPVVVPDLIDALESDDASIRRAAAFRLGRFGNQAAVTPLIEALADDSSEVQEAAGWALDKLKPDWRNSKEAERAAAKAVAALANEDMRTRNTAGVALKVLRAPDSVPALMKALKAGKDVQVPLLRALAVVGDAMVVDELIPYVAEVHTQWEVERTLDAIYPTWRERRTAEPYVTRLMRVLTAGDRDQKIQAAMGLGCYRDRRSIPVLLDAVADKDVRYYAIQSLGRIGDERAVPALREQAKASELAVRIVSMEALRSSCVVDALSTLLDGLHDTIPGVRIEAIKSLAQCGWQDSVDALVAEVGDDDSNTRGFAARALDDLAPEWRKRPSARDLLQKMLLILRDPKTGERTKAAQALGFLGDSSATLPLVGALRDRDEAVRMYAAFSLGQLKDVSATDALIVALEDRERNVRRGALKALGQMKQQRAIGPIVSMVLRDGILDSYASWALQEITGRQYNEAVEWVDWWETEKQSRGVEKQGSGLSRSVWSTARAIPSGSRRDAP